MSEKTLTHYQMTMEEYKQAIGGGYVDPDRKPEMLCRTGDGYATGTRVLGRVDCPACLAALKGKVVRGYVPSSSRTPSEGTSVRATLRRALPEGSTVWTSTQHVTRSGRVFVLPQAFLAHAEKDPSTTAEFWAGAHIASRRYVLGREFAEALGYKWNREHMGWEGNMGEDAGGGIVARLGVFAWDSPSAYSHGRIS